MGDYNYDAEYDNFDNGNFEDLGNTEDWNSPDATYGGQQPFQTPQTNNSGGYDFSGEMNNFDTNNFADLGGFGQYQQQNFGGDQNFQWNGADLTSGVDNSGLYAPANQLGGGDANSIDLGKWGGKGLDLLGKIFGGSGGSGGMSGSNAYLKTLMNLVAANQEKKSNQQMATQIPQQVQQFRQQSSPFDAAPGVVDPNSMRGIAQSQYSQSMADPYSSKIVSDQVNQMKAAQARKDAAAGRRSNTAYSSPALLAASADAAMKYQNQLGQQAGAGQFMGQSGLNELVQGLKYGAQGNSPYFSAAGYGANANNISGNPELAKLVAALTGKG